MDPKEELSAIRAAVGSWEQPMTLLEIKQQLRRGPYAWPGGYPLLFFTYDGASLCFDCVRANWRDVVQAHIRKEWRNGGWRIDGIDINWEDPDLYCDQCNARIESAYAEDEHNE